MTDFLSGFLDPLLWLKCSLLADFAIFTFYPAFGRGPFPLPLWVERLAVRYWKADERMSGHVARRDWVTLVLLAYIAATQLGSGLRLSLWLFQAATLYFGVLYMGLWQEVRTMCGLLDHFKAGLSNAEAELKPLKEPRREDEATPA